MFLDDSKEIISNSSLSNFYPIFPCTNEEIIMLEKKLGVKLPEVYKEFLLWMGHGAGDLMVGSNFFCNELDGLNQAAVDLLEENKFPELLPNDAFVFYMHQGYQFNFMRLSEGDNPPVYSFDECCQQVSFVMLFSSFSEQFKRIIEDHIQLFTELAKY